MIGEVLDALASLPWPVVSAAVGALAFLESAAFVGLVAPGESAVLLGGALAASGGPPLPVVLGVTLAGTVAGETVGFLLGRRFGPALRASRAGRWVGAARWEAADRALTEHPGRSLLTARFVGFVHAVVPALAGSSGMPFRRFVRYSVVGSGAWTLLYVGAGYAGGASYERVGARLGLVLLVAVTAAAALWLVHARRRPSPAEMAAWPSTCRP